MSEQKPKGFWGTLGQAIANGPRNQQKQNQQQPAPIRPPKPKGSCCNRGGK